MLVIGASTVQKPYGLPENSNSELYLVVADGNDLDGKIPVKKWLIIEMASQVERPTMVYFRELFGKRVSKWWSTRTDQPKVISEMREL